MDGNDAVIVNTGDTTADGEGSAGTIINGDNASFDQQGDITVTNGATGIAVNGATAKIDNSGTITVKDAGSVGVSVSGDNASFNNSGTINVDTSATGVTISGLAANVDLSGDLNVTASNTDGLNDDTGLRFAQGDGFIGVNITSNNTADSAGTVLIDGSVTVNSERDISLDVPYGRDLVGVAVNGDFNNIAISGTLDVKATPYYTDQAAYSSSLYQDNVTGLNVSGNNNTVSIADGVDVSSLDTTTGWNAAPVVTGIDVSGQGNSVSISGESSYATRSGYSNNVSFAKVNDSALLTLNEDSTLSIDSEMSSYAAVLNSHGIIQASNRSQVLNEGEITSDAFYSVSQLSVISGESGSTIVNTATGNISLAVDRSAYAQVASYPSALAGNSATIVNDGAIQVTQTSGAAFNDKMGFSSGTLINSAYQFSAISGNNTSTVENNGFITSDGGNTWGIITTADSSATNSNTGVISHSGDWKTIDGSLLDCTSLNCIVAYGGAMASTTSSTSTNNGAIEVINAGTGMLATGAGSVATNAGSITLSSDPTVGEDTPWLVAMAVTNGGTAINDETGVININADYGQAFYNDGTGVIVNYGTICAGGDCQDAATYNPTDSAVSTVYADGSVMAQAGDTTTLTNNALIDGSVSNAGTVTGQKIALTDADAVLTNQTDAVIDSAMNVNGGQFSNDGTLNGTLTQTGGTFSNSGVYAGKQMAISGGAVVNAAGGEIHNGGRLTNNAAITNHGTWYADNGQDFWTDNTTLNNAADGTLVLTGQRTWQGDNGSVLNNQGTITTDGSQGSRSSLRLGNGDNNAIINSGTITQTGGSAVLIDAQADYATQSTFWNQSGGVVNYDGTSTAVNMNHSNTVALNDGTINLSQSNAVAMNGSNNAQLVNNGTIRVRKVLMPPALSVCSWMPNPQQTR
ncbi:hypothetical protein GM30_22070 [Trabulsiella odontotermitis]|nr:hypothetical protein [Trabulsiella odontotermitis]KNC91570.1 hypothetical protein GM30_22070 [Trabulsiella odontotermitis]